MKEPQLSYFKKEDILHLSISEETETASVEIIGASTLMHKSL